MTKDANKTKAEMPRTPVALITGAAKRLGAEMAQALAADGYDIVLHYNHSKNDAQALKATLEKIGAHVWLRQGDLYDTSVLQTLWNDLPTVSLMIHNASVFVRDTLQDMTEAQLDTHMNIHVKAPLLLAQKFQKQLPQGHSGQMVLMSDSSYGASISPHFFSYAASKLALSSLTDLLASAMGPHIQVNTLALGAVLTDKNFDEESFARIAEKTPLKRPSTVSDVTSALRFLLANKSITGQVLNLSNGMTLNTHRHWQAD